MNKTFRSVWNAAKQAYVAAAETVSGKGQPSAGVKAAAVLTSLVGHCLVSEAYAQTAPPPTALPTGGQVSAGQASIGQSGAHMVIQQSTDRAAINWQTFNLGSNAQVQFNQPSAASVTLNRVMSTDPSQIFGRITANGQVILSNPAGVYFGASARVDVGGILATTHGISDADFMAGSNRFERNGSTGSVVNEGELKAALGGYIALLAPEVRNQGAVIAHMGTVALASGEAVDLSFDSNNRLTSLRVEPSQIQALVDNQHAVQAPGGLVIISAQSMDRLVGGVVKNSGSIEATGLQQKGGRIVLSASTKTENSGTLNVSNAQGLGGSVSLQGEHIELQAGSRIDATGSQGGGTVLVGGNWQGTTDPLLQATGQSTQAATTVTMAATATIDASATDKGDGGKVVLWSDVHNAQSVTTATGTIYAKGGAQGGNGGQIETSGYSVDTSGATIHAGASAGLAGLWLIDPYDYDINASVASTISNALNNDTSVTVDTASSSGSGVIGSGLGNITVSSNISKIAGAATTLTLNAANWIGGTGNIGSSGNALNVVFNAGANQGIYSGLISGNVSLTKAGAATLALTNANNYTGGTTLSGGTLGIYNNSALGTGTLTAEGSTHVLFGRSVSTLANNIVLNGSVSFAFDQNIEYLIVGGGAGGGGGGISSGPGYGGGGGGGGAGALQTGSLQLGAGTVSVEVGSGGTGGLNGINHGGWSGSNGTNGAASSFAGATAAGGLQGEGAGVPGVDSRWGGTGGASGSGFLGGLRVTFWDWSSGGGGGGGAGGTGSAVVNNDNGGAGGSGVTSTLTGTSATYAAGGAGGGRLQPDNTAGASGAANTGSGGGGGGGSRWSAGVGGTGGSGLVVARYLGGSAGSGGTVSSGSGSASGYTLHSFTATGSSTLSLNGLAVTLSGNISGSGSMVANASGGKISLTGTNTYTGTTTINSGTLAVGSGSTSGTLGSGSVINHAYLELNRSNAMTVGGAISGGGSLTQLGAGVATLTGNNTYTGATTISAGTLQIGDGGTTGTLGTQSVTNNASLVFSRSDDITVTNAISGTGSLTKSGNNTLTLTANGSYSGATTISGGTLVLKNNAPTRGTSGFNGQGTLRIESAGTAFTSGFSTSGWVFNSTLSGLTVGKDGNTADVTVTNTISIAGPISIHGGNIAINAGLISMGTGYDALITLKGSGHVTDGASGYVQTGSDGNGNLLLLGGNVTLDNSASNDVFTLAANGVSGLTYLDKAGLVVGGLGGVNGVTATGVVNIGTQLGGLRITQSVTTTSTSSNALTFNASMGSAVGSDTSYNILISGTPMISVGTGGTGRLYTGGVSGSTGLSSLSGLSAGNGRFRYNADETTNFSTGSWTALGTGLYAIYREQPSATVSSSSQVRTYGETLSLTGSGTGLVNGDTVTLSVASAQTSGAGLLKASATPYGLNHNLVGLGYSVTGSAGTVTVNAKALTVSGLSAANKPYDGNLTATVSGTAVLQAATSSGSGTASDGTPYSSDAVSLGGTAMGAFNDKDVLDANAVSFSGLSLLGADAGNYTLTPHASVNASITAKTVSLTATKTYDGTLAFTGNQLSITTGVGSETLSYSGALANDRHVATAGKFISALTLADATESSGGVASNFQLPALTSAGAGNAVTIHAATLTPTLTNAHVTKVYDGTTNAPAGFSPTWSFSGLASGDTGATLSVNAASYNNANVANANTVTMSGLGIGSISGSNGSLTTDYTLSASSLQVAATIAKAMLTVRANDDAKFVTQTDPVNFAGVSYSGFVGGEGISALAGSATVTRTNSANAAGTYAGVLQPGGSLSAANYQFNYVDGDFAIVPSNQLLVRVNNVSNTYGTATQYAISRVEYLDGNNNVVRLDNGSVPGSSMSVSNNLVTVNDGASGMATFSLAPQSAQYSTANKLKVGSYQLEVSGAVAENSQNFSNQITVVGAHQVATQAVTASTSGGVSKVYDGTTTMNGVTLALATLETNDAVSVDGLGAFNSRNVGSSLGYTISNLVLSGTDAGNYHLSGGNSFSGNNGSITARPVTLSPQPASRVYNGLTDYTTTAADLTYLSGLLGVSGDTVSAATLGFANKNVGTGKTLTTASATVSDGNNGNNFAITLGANSNSSVTRLSSVTWTGGATGNWFDPANWSGGAVPDLANVANVVIPSGVTVSFDMAGAHSPVDTSGVVTLDSLGAQGRLAQANGILNVGTGGVLLASLNQTGGTLNTSGNLTVTRDFSQGSLGRINVGGNTHITDTSGGVQLGHLNSTGTLTVSSSDGAITQTPGSAITAQDTSSFTASTGTSPVVPADITLGNSDNDFVGAVSVNSANMTLNDTNSLTLGDVNESGDLTLGAGGNIGQDTRNGKKVVVAGRTQILASGSVVLDDPNNKFQQGVTVQAASAVISGDARKTASDAQAKVAGSMPVGSLQGVGRSNPNTPQPLVMSSGASSSSSAGSSASGSASASSSGVTVDLQSVNQQDALLMVAVSLPKGISTVGTGFSFEMPESVKTMMGTDTAVQITQADGSLLPDWLKFNPQSMRFEATAVPNSALPMQLTVALTGQRIAVVISERTE